MGKTEFIFTIHSAIVICPARTGDPYPFRFKEVTEETPCPWCSRPLGIHKIIMPNDEDGNEMPLPWASE